MRGLRQDVRGSLRSLGWMSDKRGSLRSLRSEVLLQTFMQRSLIMISKLATTHGTAKEAAKSGDAVNRAKLAQRRYSAKWSIFQLLPIYTPNGTSTHHEYVYSMRGL